MKIIVRTLLILLFFSSCKKENENPQWDISVLGPLAKARLTIQDIIKDSLVTADLNGALFISVDTTFSTFDLDSVYSIPDTSIKTIQTFPPFPQQVPPNTPFYSNNNNIALSLNNAQIKRAEISSGDLIIQLKNTLRSKILFTYTIPKAKKNNIPFSVNFEIDSGSVTSPVFLNKTFDFSGYTLDMTGITGGSFNSIAYNVEARSDPAGDTFPLFGSDTLINLTTTLSGITPAYVKGYLGQTEINSVQSVDIGFGDMISAGTILLDSVNMQFDITNYIGADMQAYINEVNSVNQFFNTSVPLSNSDFIQNYININRATEPYSYSNNVTPYSYSVQLNKNNSNIKTAIENLPQFLSYDLNIKLNPLGNISGSNDFIYSDHLVNTRLRIDMPLSFSANMLTLQDTLESGLASTTDLNDLGECDFILHAINNFPFDLNVQLSLLDENNIITDTLFVPGLISSAQIGSDNRVSSPTITKLLIPVSAERKTKIINSKNILIKAALTSPASPQIYQLYSSYYLDIKLIMDGQYHIR